MDRMRHHPRRPARCRTAARPQAGVQAAALPLAVLAVLAAVLAAGPAHPQWRAGAAADPAAALDARAGDLAGYALMVDTWGDRLREAVREVQARAPAETQDGAMTPLRAHLLDVAQTAWMVVRNVPEGFGDRAAYEAAEREIRASLEAMRVPSTPTPRALDEARKMLAALDRLQDAAAAAAARAAAAR